MSFPTTVLLTLRLRGSLPAAEARALRAALHEAQAAGHDPHTARKRVFAQFDRALDEATIGPRYLDDEALAEVVAGELLMLEETGFRVPGFALLPNHAHLLLQQPPGHGLDLAKAADLLQQRLEAALRRRIRPRLPPEALVWQPGWHEVPLADEPELTRAQAYLRAQPRPAARFGEWPYRGGE